MEETKISISIRIKDMFVFQMRHAYHGIQGIIAVCISVAAFIIYIIKHTSLDDATNILLIFTALLFTVIIPFNTLFKAFKIVALSPVFQKPLDYSFKDEGIGVSQGAEEALLPWDAVIKVEEGRGSMYVYSSPKNGYILPISQLGDKYEEVKKIILESVSSECAVEMKK